MFYYRTILIKYIIVTYVQDDNVQIILKNKSALVQCATYM